MKLNKKQLREQEQKAVLRQRVADVAAGALGQKFDGDEFATANFLSRFVPALKSLFGEDGNDYRWAPANLHHFDNVDTATDFLFEYGERA